MAKIVVGSPLPDRIKLARESMRLSQPEFAAKLGVSARAVQQWEAGERRPGGDNIASLCRESGHSVEWFCGRDDFASEASGMTGMDCQSFMSALAKQQEILTNGQAMTNRLIGQNDRLIAMLEKERDDVSRLTVALTSEREWQRKREEKACLPEHHSELVEKLLARIDSLERRLQSVHGSAAFPGRAAER